MNTDRPLQFSKLIALLAIVVLLVSVSTFAIAKAPLKQDGKQSIYQRVLTRPGSQLFASPGDASGKLVKAFTRYYVYDTQEHAGANLLEVGVDHKGKVVGWVQADDTVPWKQQIALAFTNPGAERERALFFDSWETLEKIVSAPDPVPEVAALTQRIADGGRDPRVVAIEPDTEVDFGTQFYLLPILGFQETYTEDGEPMLGLEVASVTKVATPENAKPDDKKDQLKSFRAAVVFVIDSTISMQQYIDEARMVVDRVYKRVKKSGVLEKVRFGLVSFRAPSKDPETAKRLEYVSRMIVDPSEVKSEFDFLLKARKLSEAQVSTDAFDEDPYSGIKTALEQVPWTRFGARYLVLITDAGALEGASSETGLQAAQVRSRASEKGIAILALHLRTPMGAHNHASARDQYEQLAKNDDIQKSLYFPVESGSVQSFGKQVNAMADTVVESIEQASRGEPTIGSAQSAKDQEEDPETKKIREVMQHLGHAMQLAYLGKAQQASAPTVFRGWISAQDFANPNVATVDPRVLLTKYQLSDLQQILADIVDRAEAGMLDPDNFFDSLKSLAAQVNRNPDLAKSSEATKLADLGLLAEYLDDLPYKSDTAALDQDTWSRWGPQRQTEFIQRLKSKIRLYQDYNADVDQWVSLAEDGPDGEKVYPVRLRDLP